MRPTFKETLGKLYITEKLMKYKRNVLKVSFFPSCCGKRTSRLDEVPRKSRPEKMPTKPGDMLQRHNFNQSRKL